MFHTLAALVMLLSLVSESYGKDQDKALGYLQRNRARYSAEAYQFLVEAIQTSEQDYPQEKHTSADIARQVLIEQKWRETNPIRSVLSAERYGKFEQRLRQIVVDRTSFIPLTTEKGYFRTTLGFFEQCEKRAGEGPVSLNDVFVSLCFDEPAFREAVRYVNLDNEGRSLPIELQLSEEGLRRASSSISREDKVGEAQPKEEKIRSTARQLPSGLVSVRDELQKNPFESIFRDAHPDRLLSLQKRRLDDLVDLFSNLQPSRFTEKNGSIFLIAEHGSGKRSIFDEFAWVTQDGHFKQFLPSSSKDIDFFILSITALISLRTEKDCENKVDEIKHFLNQAGPRAYVIVSGDLLTGPSSSEKPPYYKSLLRLVEDPSIAVIVTHYNDDIISVSKQLEQKARKQSVKKLSYDQAYLIFSREVDRLEQRYAKRVPDEVREDIFNKGEIYSLSAKVNPGAAIDLLRAVWERVDAREPEWQTLTSKQVENSILKILNLSVLTDGEAFRARVQSLESLSDHRLIGRSYELRKIKERLLINLAPGRTRKGPLGIFFLTGPSTTGKTLIAKELGEYLYGSDQYVRIIPMETFRSPESLSTWLSGGAPPGYAGYDDHKGYQGMPQIVQANPQTIFIFDEIEKASDEVRRLFLTMMREGFVTYQPTGKQVSIQNTIIMFATNHVTELPRVASFEEYLQQETELIKALKTPTPTSEQFKEEFLTRMHGVLGVNFFTIDDYEKAIEAELQKFESNLNKTRVNKIRIGKLDPAFRRHLALVAQERSPNRMNYKVIEEVFIQLIANPLSDEIKRTFTEKTDHGNLHLGGTIEFEILKGPNPEGQRILTAPTTNSEFNCPFVLRIIANVDKRT